MGADVGTISTLESLARTAGLEAGPGGGRDLTVRRREIDEPLRLDSLSAGRLALLQVDVDGIIAVRSCVIEELVIDHCTAEALLVTNSRIGRLTIRNTPLNCELAVNESTVQTLDIHSCAATRLEGVRVADSVQISGIRGAVRLKRLRTASLTVRSQASAGRRRRRPVVVLENLHVTEEITFDDLWLNTLSLEEIDADVLILRRVRLETPLAGTGIRCREGLRVNGMVVVDDAASTVTDSDVKGTVEIRGLRHAGTVPGGAAEMVFRSSTIGRLTAASDEGLPVLVRLDNTAVTDTLALPGGSARYHLSDNSTVREVDLGDAVFRNTAQVTGFLNRVFTGPGPGALEAVRSTLALRRRNAEEDQLYYFARQRESLHGPLLRRLLTRGLLGGVLGWGVRARNPARTLVAAVLATAAAMHASGAVRGPGVGQLLSPLGASRALILSSALWLNVGTGAPSELKTYAWTALSVLFAAGGLLFTTLTVGIMIRKLVR